MKAPAILLAISGLFCETTRPDFAQFPVEAHKIGKPAVPILKTKYQRMFRTRIREAASEGPNFAGHYTVAQWGCGAGCSSIAIIDEMTGVVYDPPFSGLFVGINEKYEDGEGGIDFKPDSRLLVARGCPNERDCGTYYYEWSPPNLKLLRRTPSAK